MKLSDLSKIINIKKVVNYKANQNFSSITSNSKLVEKNSIFFYDHRSNINKNYLKEAIEKKASAVITNSDQNINITQFIVEDIDKQKETLLKKVYPYAPHQSLAVTGTNGKSSVVWYVANLLNQIKIKNKAIGTLGYYFNGRKIKESFLTTPAYEELIRYGYSKKKIKYNLIFEASSHALHQNRLNKMLVDVAVLTNITDDHLDYHKTKQNYKHAKFKLFFKHLKKNGIAIINSRIKNITKLKKYLEKQNIKIIYFGLKNICFYKKNNKVFLKIKKNNYHIKNFKLTSEIELDNLECAISCCIALGIKEKKIVNYLFKLNNPPGRLQRINYVKKKASIIIDYAHTPDALKKILKSNIFDKKKPSLVFGCGGDRDKNKRKKMSEIASKYSNKIYITNDNPRWENPKLIRKKLLKYSPTAIEIADRKKAIKTAIKNLTVGETLIIAGKGHEKFQIIKNKKYQFDDYEIAKKIIK